MVGSSSRVMTDVLPRRPGDCRSTGPIRGRSASHASSPFSREPERYIGEGHLVLGLDGVPASRGHDDQAALPQGGDASFRVLLGSAGPDEGEFGEVVRVGAHRTAQHRALGGGSPLSGREHVGLGHRQHVTVSLSRSSFSRSSFFVVRTGWSRLPHRHRHRHRHRGTEVTRRRSSRPRPEGSTRSRQSSLHGPWRRGRPRTRPWPWSASSSRRPEKPPWRSRPVYAGIGGAA